MVASLLPEVCPPAPPDATLPRALECTQGGARARHSAVGGSKVAGRGVTDEGDETADQTIVIQVMDYGGNGAEEPPVIEDEAVTVRVEGPD